MGAQGGTVTNLDPFMQAIGTALTGNAAPNAIVMHPRTWTTLLQIKTASGDTTPLVYTGVTSGVAGAVPYAIAGLPVFVSTNAMSIAETAGTVTTTSSALVLDTRGVYLALRVPTEGAEPITAVADRSYAFQENQTALLASMRVGVAVPQGAAVTRISGILA
jgi:HK97 family phage major capsid protein